MTNQVATYNYRSKLKEEGGERYEKYLEKQRSYTKKFYDNLDDERKQKIKERMKLAYYRKMDKELLDVTLQKLKLKNVEKYNFVVERLYI